MAITTHYASYQEYCEILSRIENSRKMYNISDEERKKKVNLRKDDRGEGQTSQGPRQTQSFKKCGTSSSSSSRGFSATGLRNEVDVGNVP